MYWYNLEGDYKGRIRRQGVSIWNNLDPVADGFHGICRRQCRYEFDTIFWKSCVVFCAKPKEVDPVKLISLRQVSVSIAQRMKINRIRASMNATLSFFSLKISITPISFYRRNDTPNCVTWQSSSPNQFDPEIVSPLPCSSVLDKSTPAFLTLWLCCCFIFDTSLSVLIFGNN